jgi:hypothetical protein
MQKIKYITIHWSVDNGEINEEAKKHYHYCIDRKGRIHNGHYTPEDNIDCLDGKYAAHTGGMNTGNIGVAFLGMLGYKSPKNMGNYPITQIQFEHGLRFIASLCIKYGIEPTKENVRTHYEIGKDVVDGIIPRTKLNAVNVGKIDIICLEFKPELQPNDVGIYIRNKIRWYIGKINNKGI